MGGGMEKVLWERPRQQLGRRHVISPSRKNICTEAHFSLCTCWWWIKGSCTTLALFRNDSKLEHSLQAVSERQSVSTGRREPLGPMLYDSVSLGTVPHYFLLVKLNNNTDWSIGTQGVAAVAYEQWHVDLHIHTRMWKESSKENFPIYLPTMGLASHSHLCFGLGSGSVPELVGMEASCSWRATSYTIPIICSYSIPV